MLVYELRALAADPLAWGAVPVLAAFVAYSIYHYRLCPLLHRTANIKREEAEAVSSQLYVAGPRYFLLMVSGIIAAVAGLALIAKGVYPLLAFYLLLAGLFVIQTEPTRLLIRISEKSVVAAQFRDAAAQEAALDRLEGQNRWLIGLQFMMLIAVAVFLAAF